MTDLCKNEMTEQMGKGMRKKEQRGRSTLEMCRVVVL